MNIIKSKLLYWLMTISTLLGIFGGSPGVKGVELLAGQVTAEEETVKEETVKEETVKVPVTETEIKVLAGHEKFEQDNRIDVEGIVQVRGQVNGTISCYNMEKLYLAYGLESKDNYKVLFEKIKADKSRSVLKKVFETAKEEKINYDLDFVLKGNKNYITGVYITGKSIILEYKGEKKTFISTRPQDSGAVTEQGEIYSGYIPVVY